LHEKYITNIALKKK